MSELPEVGPWAAEKLSALSRYLDFYTKVLKKQRWRTIYVDAFAGAGRAIVRPDTKRSRDDVETLFGEDVHDEDVIKFIDGSPRIAVAIANPFNRYVFIELNARRAAELETLKEEFPEVTIDVRHETAAEGIDWLLKQRISRRTHRGIAFLDPFGANLEWASVKRLSETGLFEVVINFPLSMAILRMLPNSGIVPENWAATLDRYFGDRAWFEEAYTQRSPGLFHDEGLQKREDYDVRLLHLYRLRLRAAFGHVSKPRLIRNTRGAPLYYLIWAGPHSKGLEGANYVLQMGEDVTFGGNAKLKG